jgi:hypothetical protein
MIRTHEMLVKENTGLLARIAELEAERDRLKAALEEADAIIAWNMNDWIDPRAALSGEGVTA